MFVSATTTYTGNDCSSVADSAANGKVASAATGQVDQTDTSAVLVTLSQTNLDFLKGASPDSGAALSAQREAVVLKIIVFVRHEDREDQASVEFAEIVREVGRVRPHGIDYFRVGTRCWPRFFECGAGGVGNPRRSNRRIRATGNGALASSNRAWGVRMPQAAARRSVATSTRSIGC
jgi:hypothetical protein